MKTFILIVACIGLSSAFEAAAAANCAAGNQYHILYNEITLL